MWDKIQVVTETLMVLLAVWLFAATFEPWRSQAFRRPVGRRLVITMRVIAALAAVLALVILLTDIFFR